MKGLMTDRQKVLVRYPKAKSMPDGDPDMAGFLIVTPAVSDRCYHGISHTHLTRREAWKCAAKQVAARAQFEATTPSL
jgi:hypothetical protein